MTRREQADALGFYELDLESPFRRAIALEILRMGASNPGFTISSTTLDKQPLGLETKTVTTPLPPACPPACPPARSPTPWAPLLARLPNH